jgi:DHA3 family tetracycline resistance protein-like MFS transporter
LTPFAVYLILQFCASLFFALIFTVNMIYQVNVVTLTPLQLVLVGTTLEATVFLFEIPTGVLADVKSRRLSVIIGYALMGSGFLLEGAVPLFGAVVASQVLWGLGYTFTSGATQAWVVDEAGEGRAAEVFLRGSQAASIGSLVGIPISVAVGAIGVRLPILLGGGLMLFLAAFLALVMTEQGFRPTPRQQRTTWRMMGKTLGEAQRLVGRRPLLLILLGIGLFYGLYSEGFDRLWTPHLLQNFALGPLQGVDPVLWFGVIRWLVFIISLGAIEGVRRRFETHRPDLAARLLMLDAAGIVLALAGFGLTRSFGLAVLLYIGISTLRSLIGPLYDTWFNLQIDDPQVRATMFSLSSQVDAVGQIAGGPVVGLIGNVSVRAALVASAVILSPVVPLYGMAVRRHAKLAQVAAD